MKTIPQPELIYDKLPVGLNSWVDAVPFIMSILNFDNNLIPNRESSPMDFDVAGVRIAHELKNDTYSTYKIEEADYDNPFFIARRALLIRKRYQFIPQSRSRPSRNVVEAFRQDVLNHLMDEAAPIFGIDEPQSHTLRHHVQWGELEDSSVIQSIIDDITN